MNRELTRTTAAIDRTTLALFALFGVAFVRFGGVSNPPPMAAGLLTIPLCVFGTRALHRLWPGRLTETLRAGWPLLAGAFTYLGEVHVVELLRPYGNADSVLRWTDMQLGLHGGHPDWPLGTAVEELASVAYLSYYLLVPLGFAVAWRWGPTRLGRLSLALAGTSLICGVVWLVWPSGGYHLNGGPTAPAWGAFTEAARGIYESAPHYAAAFPSEHVAHTAAAAFVLRKEGVGVWVWVWVAAVWGSTVYGQYHYALDGLAGVGAGVAAASLAYGRAERRDVGARRVESGARTTGEGLFRDQRST